jgi:hypothetical protein
VQSVSKFQPDKKKVSFMCVRKQGVPEETHGRDETQCLLL